MVGAPEFAKNWTRFVCSVVFPILRAPHHTVHFWGVQSRDDSSPAIPHAMTGKPFWPYQLLENAKSEWLRMILTEIHQKKIWGLASKNGDLATKNGCPPHDSQKGWRDPFSPVFGVLEATLIQVRIWLKAPVRSPCSITFHDLPCSSIFWSLWLVGHNELINMLFVTLR